MCAEKEELDKWMNENSFSFDTFENFVEMEKNNQDVQQFVKNRIFTLATDMQEHSYNFNLKENRVKFQDNRFNFLGLGNQVEKHFLNFEDIYMKRKVLGKDYHFTIKVSMSNKVQIQERLVHDVFTMLGNVGGLYDFFYFALSFIFGLLSKKLFEVSQVTTLFEHSMADSNDA